MVGDEWYTPPMLHGHHAVKVGDEIRVCIKSPMYKRYAGFAAVWLESDMGECIQLIKEYNCMAEPFNDRHRYHDWEAHPVMRHDDEIENACFYMTAFMWREHWAKFYYAAYVKLRATINVCSGGQTDMRDPENRGMMPKCMMGCPGMGRMDMHHGMGDDMHHGSSEENGGGYSGSGENGGGNNGGGNNGGGNNGGGNNGGPSRRKRSAPTPPTDGQRELTTTMNVIGRDSCDELPKLLNGKVTCSNGKKIGSECNVVCDAGFVRRGGPVHRCRDTRQFRDQFVYRTDTEWIPAQPPVCEDIDECLQNPCGPTFECVNTPGAFQCVCPKGNMESKGACHAGKSFSAVMRARALIWSDKLALKDSAEYKVMEKRLQDELYVVFNTALNSDLRIVIDKLSRGSVVASFRVEAVITPANKYVNEKTLKGLLVDALRTSNKMDFDSDAIEIFDTPECDTYGRHDCHRDAVCMEENLSYTCKCKHGYRDHGEHHRPGRHCHKRGEEQDYLEELFEDHGAKHIVIGLTVVVALLFAMFVVAAVIACRRRHRRHYPSDDKIALST